MALHYRLDGERSQIRRVLNKGATAAMLINTHESLAELQRTVVPVLFRHPNWIKCFPPINFPPDMKSFRRSAEKNGLTMERLEECSLEYTFKDVSSAVSWIRNSGPAAGLTASLKPERLDDFFAAVGKEVEKKNGLTITFRYLKFTGRGK